MKKTFISCVLIILSVCFVACKKVDTAIVEGKWTTKRTIKTELNYDKDDLASVYGYFYIDQIISYDFEPDFLFKKTVEQKYVKYEILPGFESLINDQLENLNQYFDTLNSVYDISGKYNLTKRKISFSAEKYTINGNEFDSDFVKENAPFLLTQTITTKYSFNDGNLILTDELGNLTEFKYK